MSNKLQVIDCAQLLRCIQIKKGSLPARSTKRRIALFGILFALIFASSGVAMAQTNPSPGRSPQPSSTPLPPNAPGSVVRPSNEVQQSTQPQPGTEQQREQTTPNTQGPRPPTPQTPGQQTPSTGLPTTTVPAGASAPRTSPGTPTADSALPGVQLTPGQNIGASTIIPPAELPDDPPPIAPNLEAP